MIFKFSSFFAEIGEDLALAEHAQEQITFQEMFPGNMKLEMFKMLGSLALLLGIFGIGVWAFKKFLKSRGHGFTNSSNIKILDRRSLTPKTSIYLIHVVNKILVIAENAEKVTLLSEFPPNMDINEYIQQQRKHSASITSDLLSKAIQKIQNKQQTDQKS
ncbi:FliO/MopB family protein [Candidatus Chlamydia sanziniae]|uniref:Flagellar protein n=1 Tax=Candidatus Chlamydia sanziniae TaxID=1806891 RepID=A0A1A9HVU7_9CHLA|nr:FliO/MopB family protein [Candidatus Chlamydia sanziniae]ANH79140.1 hypothetical protein Cs308_0970 [Candidatus Chlamydia sanziniae]